jgi:hypothetical protein
MFLCYVLIVVQKCELMMLIIISRAIRTIILFATNVIAVALKKSDMGKL